MDGWMDGWLVVEDAGIHHAKAVEPARRWIPAHPPGDQDLMLSPLITAGEPQQEALLEPDQLPKACKKGGGTASGQFGGTWGGKDMDKAR